MCESEKVERFRPPLSTLLPVSGRVAAKLQEPCLFRVQFQLELLHSFLQFLPELFGLRLVLESNHDVISEAHYDHIALRSLLPPRLDPQVKDVMKIEVRQQRRSTSALWRSFLPDHP